MKTTPLSALPFAVLYALAPQEICGHLDTCRLTVPEGTNTINVCGVMLTLEPNSCGELVWTAPLAHAPGD